MVRAFAPNKKYVYGKVNMPRKKKEKKTTAKPTYHKSKNGRYYKKTTLPSGKCQCRFVSKKEAEGGLAGSSAAEPKKTKKKAAKPETEELN